MTSKYYFDEEGLVVGFMPISPTSVYLRKSFIPWKACRLAYRKILNVKPHGLNQEHADFIFEYFNNTDKLSLDSLNLSEKDKRIENASLVCDFSLISLSHDKQISVRTCNALISGICDSDDYPHSTLDTIFIGDIICFSEIQLMRFKNFGKICLDDLKRFLAENNCVLGANQKEYSWIRPVPLIKEQQDS